jgi:ribosome biogenesis GTPase
LSTKHLASQHQDQSDNVTSSAAPPLAEGLIVDGSRGQYQVETVGGVLTCTIRGRLRKQLAYPTSATARKTVQKVTVKDKDPVAIGDRVRVLQTGRGSGVIEEVVARAGGTFARLDPEAGRSRIRSVAGLDQMVAVFAAREPTPHLRMLDRFLVLAESQDIASVICLNKVDLGIEPWLAARLAVYLASGYPVLETSAAQGIGLDALRARLAGRTSALLGPSGVGKSSLLNALEPGLGQRVSAVGSTTHKGRHTTTGARMIHLAGPGGGSIADTAGIRALALDNTALDRLDWCFPELRPYLGNCRLSDCTHLREPGCAVRAAVHTRAVDWQRYDSYCRLRGENADAAREDWEDVE